MRPSTAPPHPPGVTIRDMRLQDCEAVATIRVHGWQHAYRGLLPQLYPDRAADAGHADMALWVLRDNGPARRFYERAGLRPDGGEDTFLAGGTLVTEVRYVRPLTPPAAG
ncbi:hypothetical protein ACF08E_03125 [Streptomyces globisporus]|uniref:hypothetical protein n=1 Tax=Streptomyces globisporus TaxID=1908 RepID=UPI0036F8359D